jgi:hypothetical protein
MSGGKFTFKYEDEYGLNITYEVSDAVTVTDVLDNVANFMKAIGYRINELENIEENKQPVGDDPAKYFTGIRPQFGDNHVR